MRDETIAAFLGQLAARVPAPGGGATAALHAAQSAALVAMVARYSNGARYDAELMARIFTEADMLRDQALTLAEEDAAAFGAVSAAYQLPKETVELLAGAVGRHRRGAHRSRPAAGRGDPDRVPPDRARPKSCCPPVTAT